MPREVVQQVRPDDQSRKVYALRGTTAARSMALIAQLVARDLEVFSE